MDLGQAAPTPKIAEGTLKARLHRLPALQDARAVLQPLATSALAYAAAAVAASVVLALLPAWRRRFRT